MMPTTIRTDINGIPELQEAIKQMPLQAIRAARRANSKVAEQTRAKMASEMHRATGIPLQAFRDFRVKRRGTSIGQIVWFGANPIKAAYVARQGTEKTPGELQQQLEEPYDWGAKAGKYLFPGAFVRKMKSGHLGIFKSEGRKLIEQKVELPQAFDMATLVQEYANSRLAVVLMQELNYAMKLESR